MSWAATQRWVSGASRRARSRQTVAGVKQFQWRERKEIPSRHTVGFDWPQTASNQQIEKSCASTQTQPYPSTSFTQQEHFFHTRHVFVRTNRNRANAVFASKEEHEARCGWRCARFGLEVRMLIVQMESAFNRTSWLCQADPGHVLPHLVPPFNRS